MKDYKGYIGYGYEQPQEEQESVGAILFVMTLVVTATYCLLILLSQ